MLASVRNVCYSSDYNKTCQSIFKAGRETYYWCMTFGLEIRTTWLLKIPWRIPDKASMQTAPRIRVRQLHSNSIATVLQTVKPTETSDDDKS